MPNPLLESLKRLEKEYDINFDRMLRSKGQRKRRYQKIERKLTMRERILRNALGLTINNPCIFVKARKECIECEECPGIINGIKCKLYSFSRKY